MKRFYFLLSADLKNIFRDKSLVLIFFVPLIFIALLQFVLPVIENYHPVLKNYYAVIVATFCMITSAFPAFLSGFIMLDEKENHLTEVFQIMPVPTIVFIFYRLLFNILFGFVFCFLILASNGAINFSYLEILIISVLFSFTAPFVYLLTINLASNKIEGMSVFKGLNFVLILPVISFFIDFHGEKIAGIIPTYWSYDLLIKASGNYTLITTFLTGIIIHFIYFTVLYYWYAKKKNK